MQALTEQAERIVKCSRIIHKTIPIPMVDRGQANPQNLMGVILDREGNDIYRIAVKSGILNEKYSCNQFHLCERKLLSEALH